MEKTAGECGDTQKIHEGNGAKMFRVERRTDRMRKRRKLRRTNRVRLRAEGEGGGWGGGRP